MVNRNEEVYHLTLQNTVVHETRLDDNKFLPTQDQDSALDMASPRHKNAAPTDSRSTKSVADYKFPIMTTNGKLEGYTAVTLIPPANPHIQLIWPFTLRVGWHHPDGAMVLGVLNDLKNKSSRFSFYAAACTLDERPLGQVPITKLRAGEVVFLKDFGCLTMPGLSEMFHGISEGKYTKDSLRDTIARFRYHGGATLSDVATISNLEYGPQRVLTREIKRAYNQDRRVGLLPDFATRVTEFHQQIQAGHIPAGQVTSEVASQAQDQGGTVAKIPDRLTQTLTTNSRKSTEGSGDADVHELFEQAQSFVRNYRRTFAKSPPQPSNAQDSSPHPERPRPRQSARLKNAKESQQVGRSKGFKPSAYHRGKAPPQQGQAAQPKSSTSQLPRTGAGKSKKRVVIDMTGDEDDDGNAGGHQKRRKKSG